MVFHYHQQYEFRSKVVVEYGDPFEIPQEVIDNYPTEKRKVTATLMSII
jgi:hypothetical protein